MDSLVADLRSALETIENRTKCEVLLCTYVSSRNDRLVVEFELLDDWAIREKRGHSEEYASWTIIPRHWTY